MEDRRLQAAEMYRELFSAALGNLKDPDQQVDVFWKFIDSLPVGLWVNYARRLEVKKQKLIQKYGGF